MLTQPPTSPAYAPWRLRHPVFCCFALTFFLSWLGAFLVAAPHLLHHQPLPKMTGILMFPAMLLGASLAGILLTRVFDGPAGLRNLFFRLRRFRFPARWYTALLPVGRLQSAGRQCGPRGFLVRHLRRRPVVLSSNSGPFATRLPREPHALRTPGPGLPFA
jgi:hypothetical protein